MQLINEIYAPYLEKEHKSEISEGPYTSSELGSRKLSEFLLEHGAIDNFNKRQRIILVASGFDGQTMSAVAWLVNNGVDISCFKIIPYKIKEDVYIKNEKLLPLTEYDEYFVGFSNASSKNKATGNTSNRSKLPRLLDMLEWGVIKAKHRTDEGVLLENGNLQVNEEELSLQKWLRGIYG